MQQSKREIYFILFVFIFIGALVLGVKTFGFYQIEKMHATTNKIYKHPLKVTNSALSLQLKIYKISAALHHIFLSSSKKEQLKLIDEMNLHIIHTHTILDIIEEKIVGSQGLTLAKNTRKIFNLWQPIRDEIITLVLNNQKDKARNVIEGQGHDHILKLESSTSELYNYAQNKAISFIKVSDESYQKLTFLNYTASLVLFLLFVLIVSYTLYRISRYIYKNEYLKELYDNIIGSIDNLIFVKDTNYTYIACNTAFEIFVGKSKDEIIGKTDYDLFDKEYADAFRTYDEKILSTNTAKSNFEWVTYPDGTKTYLLTVKAPLKDLKGNILGLAGNSVDITEQKKAEDALTISNIRYETAEKVGHVGSWEYHIHSERFWASDESKRIYGFPLDASLFTTEMVENCIAEKERVHQALVDLIEKGSAYDLEFEIHPFDGSPPRIISSIASLTYDDTKKPTKVTGVIQDITERKNTEKIILEKNRQLSAFMHNLPGMSYRCANDSRWSMSFVSKGCLALTGYTEDAIINNKNISFVDIIHPDDRENVRSEIQKALMENQTFEIEYRILTANGTIKWVWEKGLGIYDKDKNVAFLEGIILDNNDRKEAEEELKITKNKFEEKSKQLKTIFDESPDPMIIYDDSGDILMINRVWEEKTGYTHNELDTIENLVQRLTPNAIESTKIYIKNLYDITQRIDNGEYEITTKSGDILIWSISSGPLSISDTGKHIIISSAKDLTELKHKDELILTQSRHAAMGEMIGMIAHQWRQPISAIAMDANNMLLDIGLDDFNTTDAEKYSRSILLQTTHLSKTIDDFRNFFRPDKEILKIKVQNIIEDTFAIVKDSLTNNHIEFKCSYESDSEVDAYQRELMQVFVNIINNAKDSLVISHKQNALINVRVYDDEAYVNIDICDNGTGIDDAIIKKIFDPYFTTKDEKTGTGLGLYMSKLIIEDHLHGKIEAYHKEEGACFRVKLLKNFMKQSEEKKSQLKGSSI